MTKTIFVGNLPWEVTERELAEVFGQYGTVEASRIALDRETHRSRGFGFVEMNDTGADRAIEALHNSEWGGRRLIVNPAKERPSRRW
ncbi:MAG: RNA-binding protein [Bacillota bacterium]|nr:RNA-binding protein [Bacillota bacterium]